MFVHFVRDVGLRRYWASPSLALTRVITPAAVIGLVCVIGRFATRQGDSDIIRVHSRKFVAKIIPINFTPNQPYLILGLC